MRRLAQQKRKQFIKKVILVSLIIILGVVGLFLLKDYQVEFADSDEHELPKIVKQQPEQPIVEEEVKPTKKETIEYTVPENQPRYLSFPRLGITNARIISVGKDPESNEIGTPTSIFDVGWYNQSAAPGQISAKSIFIDGHSGGPSSSGIFRNLPTVGLGDIITIERGDGQKFNYKIIENYSVYLDKFTQDDMVRLMTAEDEETLVVVTCTGKWINDRKTYDQRNLVRAILQKN